MSWYSYLFCVSCFEILLCLKCTLPTYLSCLIKKTFPCMLWFVRVNAPVNSRDVIDVGVTFNLMQTHLWAIQVLWLGIGRLVSLKLLWKRQHSANKPKGRGKFKKKSVLLGLSPSYCQFCLIRLCSACPLRTYSQVTIQWKNSSHKSNRSFQRNMFLRKNDKKLQISAVIWLTFRCCSQCAG